MATGYWLVNIAPGESLPHRDWQKLLTEGPEKKTFTIRFANCRSTGSCSDFRFGSTEIVICGERSVAAFASIHMKSIAAD
jgi:hypothetical protein